MQARRLGEVEVVRRTRIFQNVREVLAHRACVNVSDIWETTKLEKDLGLDSLDQQALQLDLEDFYGFQHVPYFAGRDTVEQIVDYIAQSTRV